MYRHYPQPKKQEVGRPATKITEIQEEDVFNLVKENSGDFFIHYDKHPGFFATPEKSKAHNFLLKKEIGRYTYLLSLNESLLYGTGHYVLLIKTLKYGYAVTNLTPDETKKLYSSIIELIQSANKYKDSKILEISVDAADTAYSSGEIDTCIDKILLHPDNKYSYGYLKEVTSSGNGAKVFEIYEELYGEYLHNKHPDLIIDKQSENRTLLFSRIFKEYLPDWEINEKTRRNNGFILRKKK